MHSYILRSYPPTSHISKFSSSFISYVGLGIYSTISSYAGCSKFSYSEMFGEYSILHVENALLVAQKDIFLGRVLLDHGKIAKFYWEKRKKANMKMKRCPVSMDIGYLPWTYH